MAKHMGLIGCFILALSLLFAASSEAATRYNVGDDFGWNIPPNQTFYLDWAASKTFIPGDALVFNWTGNQNVAYVPMADYNNCSTDAIAITGSPSRTVYMIALSHPGPHYFICTVDDHCERGQKLIINVEWPFSSGPSPSAQPPSSSAPTPSPGV